MKKMLVLIGVAIAATIGLVATAGTTAGANSPGQPVFTFGATGATLIIPTPACRPNGCQWQVDIFKIQPDGSQADTPDASGSGGAGSIFVQYPANWCGPVQGDYGVVDNGGVFHKTDGHKYTVTCEPDTTTTSTTVGCPPNDTPPPCNSTTTTTKPTTTTTSTTAPPVVTQVTQPPTPPVASGGPSPVVTSPTAAPVASQPIPAVAGGQLAMTGLDSKSLLRLLIIGMALIAAGLVIHPRRRGVR
jgi:hypothetical protein